MAIHRASQTSSHALTARAFGAHGGGRCQVWARPTPGTFLPRTARMRAVLYEKTTLRSPDGNTGLLQRWEYRLPSGGQGGGTLFAGGGGRRDLAHCPHLFLFSPPPKAAKKTLQQPCP